MMNRFFPVGTALILLLMLAGTTGMARAAEVKPGAEGADVLFEAGAPQDAQTSATQSAMGTELDKLGEELCFLALTNFKPGAQAPGAAPGQASWTANRTSSPELNKALTEFAAISELPEGEKVTRIVNEVVVGKGAAVGDTVRLSDSYKDIKLALNDHTGGPVGDADIDELVGLVSCFLGPIRVHHSNNNLGPQDYCFKAVFETTERKFRLNILKHDGKYVWFVEDVI